MPSPISNVIKRIASIKESVLRTQNNSSSFLANSARLPRKTSVDVETAIANPSSSNNLVSDKSASNKSASGGPLKVVSHTGKPRRHITWKRVLYHPLTWLAAGLHVALLEVPFNPVPPVAIEQKEETEEPDKAIPIDLLNLSEIATSEPPPATPLTEPPPAAPPATPPAPAPQQAASVALPPTDAPLPPDPAQASTPDPEPQTPEPATPTPEPTPPLAYDPSGDQQLFVQNLGAIGLNTYDIDAIGLPGARDFKEPANAPFFLNGEHPVPNAKSVQQIDKEPGDVYGQVTSSYASTGITFTQEPAYGGEELYHAITPQGQTLMYFSLVRLKGSTLLVIWNELPA